MKNYFVTSIILILTLNSLALAQDPLSSSWTLQRFLKQSLSKSGSIVEQTLLIEKQGALVEEKKSAFLPSLNATAQFNRASSQTTVVNQSGQTLIQSGSNYHDNSATALNLSQNLFNGLRDYKSLKSAEASQKSARALLQESQRAQAEAALKTYFAVLKYQADLINQKKELEINQQSLKDAQQRNRIGSARQSEAINLQASIANNNIDLSTTENNLSLSKAEALRLVQDVGDDNFVAQYDKILFTSESVEKVIANLKTEDRADLAAQKQNTESKQYALDASKGLRLPTLDLSANYNLTQTANPAQENKYSASLILTIPFPWGFEKAAQIDQSVKDLQIAQLQTHEKYKDLEKERQQLIQTIQNNIVQVKNLEAAIQINKTNVAQLKKDQSSGLSTYSDVLTASATYQQTLRKYDEALLDFELNCYRALIWSGNLDRLLEILGE